MTTKTKSNETNSPTGEQSTFAPLGKYAAIAVVMVGIIVTTAIMLDKQLDKAETDIASIESEIAELNKVQANATATTQTERQVQVAAKQATTVSTSATDADIEVAEIDATEIDTSVNNSLVNNQPSEVVASTVTAQTNAGSHQSRIESYKVQQRSRMTEMFDRIKQLESKQLEQYKVQQAEQVARLRNRVSTQQEQIDTLIQRNENLFELRSASMQRSQAQREQMLNRI